MTGGFQRYSRHALGRAASLSGGARRSASCAPRSRPRSLPETWLQARTRTRPSGRSAGASRGSPALRARLRRSRTSGAAALPFVSRASARISSRGPMAAMRSPEMATAAGMTASPPVNTRSLSMIVSMRIRCSFPNVPLRVRIVVLRSAHHPSPSASRSRHCTPCERGAKRHAGLCEGFRSSDGASSRRAAWSYASPDARPCALAVLRPALGSRRKGRKGFRRLSEKKSKTGLDDSTRTP